MTNIKTTPYKYNGFPNGLLKITYQSELDGLDDWALVLPSDSKVWVVAIHGHGSNGDQLFKRHDIRDCWLPQFYKQQWGILTPNLRGNAWMCPEAAADLRQLLSFVRKQWNVEKFVFCSGSMGGTSNLIYSVLYPEDVSAAIALCPSTDLASYFDWCDIYKAERPILAEIKNAIMTAYKGAPSDSTAIYQKHSVLFNSHKLTMPLVIAHGTNDLTIPVSQSRKLIGALSEKENFFYKEIPAGGHDSPLYCVEEAIGSIKKFI